MTQEKEPQTNGWRYWIQVTERESKWSRELCMLWELLGLANYPHGLGLGQSRAGEVMLLHLMWEMDIHYFFLTATTSMLKEQQLHSEQLMPETKKRHLEDDSLRQGGCVNSPIRQAAKRNILQSVYSQLPQFRLTTPSFIHMKKIEMAPVENCFTRGFPADMELQERLCINP